MHGAREAMEVTGLYASCREQLANVFQGVDGLLRRLGGEAVHQIGVYEDSRVGEGPSDPGHLPDRDAFLHEFEQAIRCHFQSACNGDATAFGQQLAEGGIERLLETNVTPPRDIQLPLNECLRKRLQCLGRRRFVDEVKSSLPGLAHQRFDSSDQHIGSRQVVARDVVKVYIAEAAFLPIAAVCDRQLVPAPVRPETVHGVEHVQQ